MNTTATHTAIPTQLSAQPYWSLWAGRLKKDGLKWDKVPKSTQQPGRNISVNTPEQWGDFDSAVKALQSARIQSPATPYGLGLLLTNNQALTVVDIDNAFEEDGKTLKPAPREWVKQFASYTEISPSGKGLHVFFTGHWASDWVNHNVGAGVGLEVYSGNSARFITVTGQRLPHTPETLAPVPVATLQELQHAFGRASLQRQQRLDTPRPDTEEAPDQWWQGASGLSQQALCLLQGEATTSDGATLDRSAAVQSLAVSLYRQGLNDAQVLGHLASCPPAFEVALAHRQQHHDKALDYLWFHHVLPAKAKTPQVQGASSFDALTQEEASTETPETRQNAPERPTTKIIGVGGISTPEKRKNASTAVLEASASIYPINPLDDPDDSVFDQDKASGQSAHRNRNGAIVANLPNLEKALLHPGCAGVMLKSDTFLGQTLIRTKGQDWRPINDSDYTEVRLRLEKHCDFAPIAKEMIRDMMDLVATRFTYDSATQWAQSLQWDGQPRVAGFFKHYFACEASDYHRAVSLYLWTAMAGRLLEPGIKADMVPILVGEQGVGKTSAVMALVPFDDWFAEINLGERDDDLLRSIKGKAVCEIGELRGLHTKDSEGIKSLITRRVDEWIPKYKEHKVRYARRCVFIGTTNETQFLADPTGNRRWLPVKVQKADIEAIKADREQLWAEAVYLFKQFGIQHQQAEALAKAQHAEFEREDGWVAIIAKWLDAPNAQQPSQNNSERTALTGVTIATEALGLQAGQVSTHHLIRIGAAMKKLGWAREQKRTSGARTWFYMKENT